MHVLLIKAYYSAADICLFHTHAQSDQLMRQYFVQREGEQRELRRLVEATMAGHQGTREARIRLQRMKQKIGEIPQDCH